MSTHTLQSSVPPDAQVHRFQLTIIIIPSIQKKHVLVSSLISFLPFSLWEANNLLWSTSKKIFLVLNKIRSKNQHQTWSNLHITYAMKMNGMMMIPDTPAFYSHDQHTTVYTRHHRRDKFSWKLPAASRVSERERRKLFNNFEFSIVSSSCFYYEKIFGIFESFVLARYFASTTVSRTVYTHSLLELSRAERSRAYLAPRTTMMAGRQ